MPRRQGVTFSMENADVIQIRASVCICRLTAYAPYTFLAPRYLRRPNDWMYTVFDRRSNLSNTVYIQSFGQIPLAPSLLCMTQV